LAIWNSPPVSEVLSQISPGEWPVTISSVLPPPISAGNVTLKPNLVKNKLTESSSGNGDLEVSFYGFSEGADQMSTKFYLEEGQWMYVVVSSGVPINFQTTKPGGVSFNSHGWVQVSGYEMGKELGLVDIPSVSHHPYSEKVIYENRTTSYVGSFYKTTLFSTAALIFAWGGAGDYAFEFTNFNSQKGANIQYRVYKLGATPAWGNTYANTMLAPWLNELKRLRASGIISEDEYNKAIGQWLEQFK